MDWIGELWAERAITVADEHLATAISQQVLIRLYDSLQCAPPRSRERVLLAAVEGQHHVLGLRMVADLLEGAGFDVLYLGADVPTGSLAKLIQEHEPALVGLTSGVEVGSTKLWEAIAAVQESGWPTRVLLGGDAVPEELRNTAYPWVESSADVLEIVAEVIDHPPPTVPPEFEVPSSVAGNAADSALPYDANDSVARIAASVETATVQARHYAQRAGSYRYLALHDPVTELPNRRAFDDRIHSLCARSTDGVFLMLDLDGFKGVNDSHGHQAGDDLLRMAGAAINLTLRVGDFAARIGGDEFGVLLPGRSAQEGAAIAERIRDGVRNATEHGVTASVGLTPLTPDIRGVLITADRALYRAKASGGDQVASSTSLSANASGVDGAAPGERRANPRVDQHPLTKREREVLDHVARGLLTGEIASLLVLSPETIKSHVRNAMLKLGAQTRAHAVSVALESGQIMLPAFGEDGAGRTFDVQGVL
jgi:diguanylate cyclase (GGDEF)-like protein